MSRIGTTLGCAACLAVGGILLVAAASSEPIVLTGETMGTTYRVRLGSLPGELPGELTAAEIQSEVDRLLEAVNDQMSTYRETSELSRFNRRASTEWFPVSPETAYVVGRALEAAADSGGAFDPTIAPLVRLWGFGPGRRAGEVPTDEQIAAALEHVGFAKIEVREDPPALRKTAPLVELDLSAIAKGYAVDCVSERLAEFGIASSMVEIGGEVRTTGVRPDGEPWQIGIDSPTHAGHAPVRIIGLSNAALATSGDYRNYFEVDGERFSHTINPLTGRPVRHTLGSVTVAADDCATADALATTLMVLGPDAGLHWAEEQDVAAWLLVYEDDEAGSIAAAETTAFTQRFAESHAADQAASGTPWWVTLALAAGIVGLAVFGLSIGAVLGNRRLRGSCGGLAEMTDADGNPICSACTNPREECDEFLRRATAGEASDASEKGTIPDDERTTQA